MERIKVDLGFTRILSFVLDDDFGSIDGLYDGRSDTARKRTNDEWLSVLFEKTI